MKSHDLVCLLPARNCEHDLPGYFDSVWRFADAVVALDNGSTDSTGQFLKEHPAVKILLSNPRRETYRGWDDAGNRNRLLAAAAALNPKWILSLDADERITPDDAEALRSFLRDGALPGVAYGFKLYRMIADLRTYDKFVLWSYRLFAHREGQRFPIPELHLIPAPTEIPPERWIKTTLRIQRLSRLTEERRAACYKKYREADSEGGYQAGYKPILDPPKYRKTWVDRVPSLPVVKELARHRGIAMQILGSESPHHELDLLQPKLSAIVIAQNDLHRMDAVMGALMNQQVDQPIEIILVDSGSDGTAAFVRKKYPEVRVIHLPEPVLPGRARNEGLKVARGDYVSFPGSHIVLSPKALQNRMDAHALGYAMVTGTALNGTRTLSGWASYFLDHSEALPGRPSSDLDAPPSHCSYLKEALIAVGGFLEDRRIGEDTVVNCELSRRGYKACRSSKIQFVHNSPCRTPIRLWRHHLLRGLGFGRILWEQSGRGRTLRSRLPSIWWLMTKYPWRRVRFITRNVVRWGKPVRRYFLLSLPLILTGIASAALGALAFLFRPASGRPDWAVSRNPSRSPRSADVGEPEPSRIAAISGVPTIFYVVTAAARDAMNTYVTSWGPTHGSRMAFLYYEDLPRAKELPVGTYIFSDLEVLSPEQLKMAVRVWEQLSQAGPPMTLLNNPARVLCRYELLQALFDRGINRFRAIRATDSLESLRFPVFLKLEAEHNGSFTSPLHSPAELKWALIFAKLRGFSLRDLLVIEFCNTADVAGVFRKYSAFIIGDEILPRHLFFSHDWEVKHPELQRPEFDREERNYLEKNPHEPWLRQIFKLAGTDYGRVDYSLLGGDPQIWEINTNPTVRKMATRLTLGLEAIDCAPDSLEPIPIEIDPGLIRAVEVKERKRRRAQAIRVLVHRFRLTRLRRPLERIVRAAAHHRLPGLRGALSAFRSPNDGRPRFDRGGGILSSEPEDGD